MNYIERLLESQFASDELKDYLDQKEKKGNPKLSQKHRVAINGDKNKEVSRRAKGLQDAPNSHRFAVQLNSKFRFNNIKALAQPDGKYRNLVWVLASRIRVNQAFKYINEFLGLEPNNTNIEIGDFQIRFADVSKKGTQQYFIRQNGLEFMKTMEQLQNDDSEEDGMRSGQNAEKTNMDQESPESATTKQDSENADQKSENNVEREKWIDSKYQEAKKSDEYHEDVIGFDPKKKKPVYRPYSKGWWAQRGEKAKELGIDISKWNFDPTTWKMSQSLKKAS